MKECIPNQFLIALKILWFFKNFLLIINPKNESNLNKVVEGVLYLFDGVLNEEIQLGLAFYYKSVWLDGAFWLADRHLRPAE